MAPGVWSQSCHCGGCKVCRGLEDECKILALLILNTLVLYGPRCLEPVVLLWWMQSMGWMACPLSPLTTHMMATGEAHE